MNSFKHLLRHPFSEEAVDALAGSLAVFYSVGLLLCWAGLQGPSTFLQALAFLAAAALVVAGACLGVAVQERRARGRARSLEAQSREALASPAPAAPAVTPAPSQGVASELMELHARWS